MTAAPAQQARYSPAMPYGRETQSSGWHRNQFAFITFGIVALYIIIALKAHVYVLGVLPVAMSMRSKSRNEPLAIAAIIAAAVAVVIALVGFTHH